MIDQATTDMLKSMKLSAMGQEFEGQLSEPAGADAVWRGRGVVLLSKSYHRIQIFSG